MKKLKLAHKKIWFTLKEAAEYLSLVFDEPVTEQHIVQFSLDGQLPISFLARRLMVVKTQQSPIDYSFFKQWSEKGDDNYEHGEYVRGEKSGQDDFVSTFRHAFDYFSRQPKGELDEMNLTLNIPIDPGDGVRFVDGIYSIKMTENIREMMLDFVQGKETKDDGFLLFADGTTRVIVPEHKQWVLVDNGGGEFVVLMYRFETTNEEFDGKVRSVTKQSYISPSSTPPQPSEWIIQQRHLMQFERSISEDTDQIPDGSIIVSLPHMTKTLAAVFDIMRKNWDNHDPKRAPLQKNIAREIDHALGWKSLQSGEPSRGAQVFAAAIRPDDLSESDSRVSKRKR